MDSKKLAQLCRKTADDKKAEDIVVLDLRKLSSFADFFVIMSATSEPHMRAIADALVEKTTAQTGSGPRAVDGTKRASWMVIDYVDVVVHILRSDARSHYDLEGLWGDAPRVKANRPRRARPAGGAGAV